MLRLGLAGPHASEEALLGPRRPGVPLSPRAWPGTRPDPGARAGRSWNLGDKPGIPPGRDDRKQSRQQRGRRAAPPGSWGLVWLGSGSASREQPRPARARPPAPAPPGARTVSGWRA